MIKRFTAISAALLLSACMTVEVPEGHFFYPETRLAAEKIVLKPGAALPADAETLSLAYAGGVVAATRVRTGRTDAPLVLFCGGNMFRRGVGGGEVAGKLTPFGDVLMFDYPGYGDTAGTADLAAFEAAGAAVASEARARTDAEGRRLIVWGHSLGGPVCAQLAVATRADALVLEATTPTARAAVNEMIGLWRPLVRVRLAPALDTIDVPASLDAYPGRVLVLEAGKDDTLPPALSRRLTRDLQARGVAVERLVFPQAGHNDIGRQPDFAARVGAALAG